MIIVVGGRQVEVDVSDNELHTTSSISSDTSNNNVNLSNNELHTSLVGADKPNNAIDVINNQSKYYSDLAKGYAEDANNSAIEAKQSETNALSYKNSAETSASNAKTSEDNAKGYANNAEISANNAKDSEDNALIYKNSAKDSENNALEYKNNASASATNAQTSETNAKDSEEKASIWAEGNDNQVSALGGTHSAKNWSIKTGELITGFDSHILDAQNSFDLNATQKTNDFNSNATTKTNSFNSNYTTKLSAFNSNATDKQTLIDDKANEASESARKALNSQTLAKQSEDNALTSETNAKTSEDNAKTSENNASNYASNALTSETNSKTSENNAKASENNAKDYASNAKTSENNALTYQNNAKTSETNAKASETECQRLVNSLENIYRYKGSVPTYDKLPTTGNTVGDVWNVIENDVNYAWTGTEWDSLGGQSVDLTGYATKEEVNAKQDKLNANQLNAVNSGITSELVNKYNGYQATINNKANSADLSTVATSGSYNDLTNKPTIPTQTSELTNDSGFISSIPSEYITETELSTELANKQDNLTLSQLNAVNSGITSSLVSKYNGYETTINGKADSTDLSGYLPLTGGALSGNLTAKYLTGTWLQTTSATKLNSTANKVAVIDPSGWIYYKSPADIVTDGTTQTQQNAINSGITSDLVKKYNDYQRQLIGKQDILNINQLNAINSGITSNKVTTYDGYQALIDDKQPKGNYIKTVNNEAPDVNGNINIEAGGGGGYPVGAIVTSLTPLKDANLHLLDGALLPVGGTYDQFITKFISELFVDHPECFITESEWQQQVTTHGVCDKYVYTPNVSVRLPKLGNQIFTQNDKLGVQGNGNAFKWTTDGVNEIAISTRTAANLQGYFHNKNMDGIVPLGTRISGFPNRNTAFGLVSNPVTSGIEANLQSTTTCYYYICVSSKTKTDIQSNIDNIATDLNNKADKDLLNTPDNVDVVVEHKINSDGSWYRKYKSGWLEQGGRIESKVSKIDVVFPKPFINTNYTTNFVQLGWDDTGGGANSDSLSATTTTSMAISHYTSSSGIDWYACGQGV